MCSRWTVKQIALAATVGLPLVASAGGAQAQYCSTASLQGRYSVSFHGEVLGMLNNGVLIPLPTPTLVDGVEIMNFDGAGNFTNLALAVGNGVPVAAGTPGLNENGFQPQTGTYSVSPDCTGTGLMIEPTQNFTFALILGNGGRTLRSVITKQHVASIENNPNCGPPSGCDLAAQVSTVGEKLTTGKKDD
jgi:hypothetical protein